MKSTDDPVNPTVGRPCERTSVFIGVARDGPNPLYDGIEAELDQEGWNKRGKFGDKCTRNNFTTHFKTQKIDSMNTMSTEKTSSI